MAPLSFICPHCKKKRRPVRSENVYKKLNCLRCSLLSKDLLNKAFEGIVKVPDLDSLDKYLEIWYIG